ncbi:MAG: thiol-disulfide oxidoreductase DCC family protein [Bacteroidota bacterium]
MCELIKNKTIILFDGVCNLCNDSVKFVLKHEKKSELYFSSLQSETAKNILKHFNYNKTESVVLIENNKLYVQSSAALRITRYLKGGFPFLFFLIIVPPFIRHSIYNYIAKNRYKWFGKRETCMMPDEKIKHRFI